MKKLVLSLCASFLVLLFASSSLYAESCGFSGNRRGRDIPGGQGMPMIPPMMHHAMEMRDGIPGPGCLPGKRLMDLGLDEKQRTAVREIKSGVIKNVIKKEAEIAIAKIELMDILDKDPVDISAAEATLKKIESLITDVHLLYIKEMEAIKTKLTPEQRKKLKDPPQKDDSSKKNEKGSEAR
jgi:Spy/CpxP family protein refolding chaperone